MESYTFCRTRQERRIWAIKGLGGMGKPIWPRRSSHNNKGRVPHFMVGVDAAKESIYSRLRLKEPGPGYCHFPLDRDAEWFRQLTAEKITTRYNKGRPIREWVKKSDQTAHTVTVTLPSGSGPDNDVVTLRIPERRRRAMSGRGASKRRTNWRVSILAWDPFTLSKTGPSVRPQAAWERGRTKKRRPISSQGKRG
ncbi:hypothetical protein WCLP8_4950001 [uncultured Gammaproteobacteria bacterium]